MAFSMLKRPSAKASILGACAMIYILTFAFANRAPRQDPTSVFFNQERAYKPRYSAQRQQQAQLFVSSVASSLSTDSHSYATRNFCIGVPTISRRGTPYLPATIGSLVDSLNATERSEILLFVLIADIDPNSHPSYHETWLHTIADQVITYSQLSKKQREYLATREQDNEAFREKALFDYAFLLRACYETGAEFVAIVEDDVVAAERWFRRVKMSLRDLEGKNWLYLRLFYTEAFLGWNAEDWPHHTLWSIGFILSIVLFARWLHVRSRCLRETFSLATTTVSSSLYATALVILFFTSDRTAVWPLRVGTVEMDQYGCCAQGLLFPRGRIEGLLSWFNVSQIGFVDVLIEAYGNAHDGSRWTLNPSVLQHVGANSSKGQESGSWGRSNYKRIWSFAFENGV